MSAEPTPRRLAPGELLLNALADIQDVVAEHRELAAHLHKILEPQQAPGDLRYVHLTAARPASTEAEMGGSRSFTVINPYDFAVNIGVGGIGASNIAAIEVPPGAALTLPVAGEILEIGVAPAELAAGDAWVNVIQYRHVHPFFLGAA